MLIRFLKREEHQLRHVTFWSSFNDLGIEVDGEEILDEDFERMLPDFQLQTLVRKIRQNQSQTSLVSCHRVKMISSMRLADHNHVPITFLMRGEDTVSVTLRPGQIPERLIREVEYLSGTLVSGMTTPDERDVLAALVEWGVTYKDDSSE
jgi:hypothetical protein